MPCGAPSRAPRRYRAHANCEPRCAVRRRQHAPCDTSTGRVSSPITGVPPARHLAVPPCYALCPNRRLRTTWVLAGAFAGAVCGAGTPNGSPGQRIQMLGVTVKDVKAWRLSLSALSVVMAQSLNADDTKHHQRPHRHDGRCQSDGRAPLLIAENRIVAVGQDAPDGGGDDDGLTVIDAAGAVVIPGIIDQHLHWNRSAITWGYALHRGENAFTLADLEDALRTRAAEVPEGQWIALIGRHNHRQFLEDPDDPGSGRYPTRQELDEWAPDHRVLFSQRFMPRPVGAGQGDFNRADFSAPGQMNSSASAFFNAMTQPVPPRRHDTGGRGAER